MESKNENNKNMVMLVVIAIITLMVLVTGATFAYLASNIMPNKTISATANTAGSSDVLLFGFSPNELSLNVTESDLAQAKIGNDVTNSVTGTVIFQSNTSSSQKYDLYLTDITNNFEYTSGVCSNTDYDNKFACEAYESTWTPSSLPELVVDLYEGTKVDSAASCNTTVGKCINTTNNTIVADVTTQTACDATENTKFIANSFDSSSSVCYVLNTTKDVTEEDGTSDIYLLSEKTISSDGTSQTKHYYKVTIAMHNLQHNQLMNANKGFDSKLQFKVHVDE